MEPSTEGAAAMRDFVSHKPLRNILSECADRDLVQQHCHSKDQGHSPKAKGL